LKLEITGIHTVLGPHIQAKTIIPPKIAAPTAQAPATILPTPPVNVDAGILAIANPVPTAFVNDMIGPDEVVSFKPRFGTYCFATPETDGVAPAGIEILQFVGGEA